MVFTTKQISNWTLGVLSLISTVFSLVVWFGPEVSPGEPILTETLLNWTYFLIALSVIVTLVLQVMKVADKIAYDKREGFKILYIILGMAVIGLVSYLLSDGTVLKIPGYTGTENVAFWLQMTDIMLFVMYFFFIVSIGLLVFSEIYRMFK